jgi:hypothetical protein
MTTIVMALDLQSQANVSTKNVLLPLFIVRLIVLGAFAQAIFGQPVAVGSARDGGANRRVAPMLTHSSLSNA